MSETPEEARALHQGRAQLSEYASSTSSSSSYPATKPPPLVRGDTGPHPAGWVRSPPWPHHQLHGTQLSPRLPPRCRDQPWSTAGPPLPPQGLAHDSNTRHSQPQTRH